jgi:Cu-Zn family superoxide dismutase
MDHRHLVRPAILVGLAAAAVGVAVASAASADDTGASHATAALVDGAGHPVGTATFVEDATGHVHLNVKVDGLTEGLHGIHLHSVGSCVGPSFASAGGHINPGGVTHGNHAGDLPNLIVNAAGQGRLNTGVDSVTLSSGAVSVFDANGSAVVIHALPDDFVTDPAGNSGPRIACGVIVAD